MRESLSCPVDNFILSKNSQGEKSLRHEVSGRSLVFELTLVNQVFRGVGNSLIFSKMSMAMNMVWITKSQILWNDVGTVKKQERAQTFSPVFLEFS